MQAIIFFCSTLTLGLFKLYNLNNMEHKIMVQKNMDEILNEYNMSRSMLFFCNILAFGAYLLYKWNKIIDIKYKTMVQKNMNEILNEYNMTQIRNT